MEARILIEPGLARLAALHATNADLREMDRCIRKSKAATHWRIYESWDNSLHRAFAVATHNAPLISLFDTFNVVRRSMVWGRRRAVPLVGKPDHHSFRDHDAIFAAISERHAERAEASMRAHLTVVRDKLLAAMEGVVPQRVAASRSVATRPSGDWP